MVRMLQGAGHGGLKEWMLQIPHRGGLVDQMAPLAGPGGSFERMLQGPRHGEHGGLELGVLAAHSACRTSWSGRALGQGTGEGRRSPQPWSPHPRLAVVAPAAALQWPMRSALWAASRAGPTAVADGRWGFRFVHPCALTRMTGMTRMESSDLASFTIWLWWPCISMNFSVSFSWASRQSLKAYSFSR